MTMNRFFSLIISFLIFVEGSRASLTEEPIAAAPAQHLLREPESRFIHLHKSPEKKRIYQKRDRKKEESLPNIGEIPLDKQPLVQIILNKTDECDDLKKLINISNRAIVRAQRELISLVMQDKISDPKILETSFREALKKQHESYTKKNSKSKITRENFMKNPPIPKDYEHLGTIVQNYPKPKKIMLCYFNAARTKVLHGIINGFLKSPDEVIKALEMNIESGKTNYAAARKRSENLIPLEDLPENKQYLGTHILNYEGPTSLPRNYTVRAKKHVQKMIKKIKDETELEAQLRISFEKQIEKHKKYLINASKRTKKPEEKKTTLFDQLLQAAQASHQNGEDRLVKHTSPQKRRANSELTNSGVKRGRIDAFDDQFNDEDPALSDKENESDYSRVDSDDASEYADDEEA